MFIILLIGINLTISFFGIYLFDYNVDGSVNDPLIIISSILVGTIAMVVSFFIYIEAFYVAVGKRRPDNSKLKHFLAKQLMTVPLFLFNIRIKVIGIDNLPNNPGFTIYSNHTSNMDIPILMYKLKKQPVAFLSKEDVKHIFSIGKCIPTLGTVLIDRSNPRSGAESIVKVIKNVKSGLTMVVFPEGTFSQEIGKLLEFKPGSFKVALKSNAPLVPITIVCPKIFKNVKWPFPKRVTLVIHEPIPFNEFKEMTSLDLSIMVKKTIEEPLQ